MNRKNKTNIHKKIGENEKEFGNESKINEEIIEDDQNTGITLRIRPLDVNTKLPVYYDESEEFDEAYFIHNDGIARQRRPTNAKKYGIVPIPSFRVIESPTAYVVNFKRPNKYIKYDGSTNEIKNDSIEYDLCKDDEDFLYCINETYFQNTKDNLNELDFEMYIDYFEKEYASEKSLPLQSIIDRAHENTCAICIDYTSFEKYDSDEDNKGINCLNCGIFVHFRCYDLIESELWTCERCIEKKKSIYCFYCGSSKGFLKKDKDSIWCHLFCLEYYQNTIKRRSSRSSNNLNIIKKCSLCDNQIGNYVDCSFKSCNKSFHPRCANIYGLYIEQIKSRNKYFCRRHSPLEPIDKILLRIDLTTSEMNIIKKTLSKSKKLKKVDTYIIKLIYLYWVLKRYVYGRELIYRLYMLSKDSRRQKEQIESLKNKEMKMKTLLILRHHLERIRLLADLCKKRENTKRQYLYLLTNFFDIYENQKYDKSSNLPNENHQRRKIRALDTKLDDIICSNKKKLKKLL